MTEQPHREAAVLNAALELHAEERAAYLDQACAGDAALRRQVEALLRAHEQAESFLEAPPAGLDFKRSARVNVPLTEKPGDKIGRYKLLQQIGEGGCGVVYMAEQEEPVRRRVALKVIKLGMDTKQVIARFEAERQALALMDHPNIAKIHDAGITGAVVAAGVSPAVEPGFQPGGTDVDDSKRVEGPHAEPGGKMPPSTAGGTPAATLSAGRPYFVMELVRGIKITEFCDENKLSTEDRLKLFIQVCQAIQHAHQKGVIHRDIKPSNILVTVNDGVPVPKVIDFGIAKATQGRLTDHTLFTAFEQFIGTPAYMSPEQAVMTSLDIDTRSDIYSLGVLLYELLTGRPPFDQKELLAAGLDEMRRTIREKEPPKPSTRLTQELVAADVRRLHSKPQIRDGKSEDEVRASSRRLLQMKDLIHALRGDLDWIAMKCLEKDRARRYETANGLAADIQRHLSNEPVVACPPGNLYRFQKLVRRNKLAFTAVSAVTVALLLGLGVSTWALLKEREARQQAEADKQAAKTEAVKSKQVAQFLQDMLQGIGPSVAFGRDTKLLREILDKTAERISKDLTNQPEVEADLRVTIGRVYGELGDDSKAEEMLRPAIPLYRKLGFRRSGSLGDSLCYLSNVLNHQGNGAEAEALTREALDLVQKKFGNESKQVAAMLTALDYALYSQGRLTEAEKVCREALAMQKKFFGNEDKRVAGSLHNLASALSKQGKQADAETMMREALAMRIKLLGKEHPDVAMSLCALAEILGEQGKLAEAETTQREALAQDRKFQGDEHPATVQSLESLALVLSAQGKLAEAEASYREALHIVRKRWPDGHRDVAVALNELAIVLRQQGNLAEAETMNREALAMYRKLLGNEHPFVCDSLHNLANVLLDQGKLAEAEALNREALDLQKKRLGADHPDVTSALMGLAFTLKREGKLAEVKSIYSEIAKPGNVEVWNNFAWFLATCADPALRDGATAVTFAEKAVAGTQRTNVSYLDTLAAAYAEAGDFVKAVNIQKEAIALSPSKKGKDGLAVRLKLYESNTPYREP